MLRRIICAVIFLLTACQPVSSSILPPSSTPTFAISETKVSSYNLRYQLIYKDGDFEIREAFLGEKDLSKFVWLPTRIKETVTNYDPPTKITGDDWCASLQQTGWCSQDVRLSDGNQFNFQCDSGTFARNCKLSRNGINLWSGHMNGAQGFPIESIKRIGNEIAISYVDADTNRGVLKLFVVATKENSFIQVENAYSPNEVLGKLLYFRSENDKEIMVFSEQDIPEEFDAILHWPCCGGGYDMNINSNGKVVDFFARKGSDWYHVQAGDAKYLATLNAEGK